MKRLFALKRLLLLVALFLIFCSCNDKQQESSLAKITGVERNGIPDPTIINHTEIPRPYSKSTYFLYSGGREVPESRFAEGNIKLILQKLLERGFDIREAWNATGEWGCQMRKPTWDQMIIRLEAPNARIHDFGFTIDSSLVQIFENPACRPSWEHYRFD
ncbi:MAG: hypothetical protein ACREOI_18830 [bacterium]